MEKKRRIISKEFNISLQITISIIKINQRNSDLRIEPWESPTFYWFPFKSLTIQ